jgi:hypothetical protein
MTLETLHMISLIIRRLTDCVFAPITNTVQKAMLVPAWAYAWSWEMTGYVNHIASKDDITVRTRSSFSLRVRKRAFFRIRKIATWPFILKLEKAGLPAQDCGAPGEDHPGFGGIGPTIIEVTP